jgi:type III pantothenate kinase
MIPDIVVDVGNSRIKWGRCATTAVESIASLLHDAPQDWQDAFQRWNLTGRRIWIVAGVNPKQRDSFMDWLTRQGQSVHLLESPGLLPLAVRLERPDHVGIDRLLNAVAANSRRPAETPAVLVDAGSAVTVDWLDESGGFCGGAILPGLRLMTQALHNYTALLPLVHITASCPELPAVSTRAAVEAGVYWTAAGGVNTLIARLAGRSKKAPAVFLAGGDAPLLAPALSADVQVWPEITLEGIRLTALSW